MKWLGRQTDSEKFRLGKRKDNFLEKKVTGFVVSMSSMKAIEINRDMKDKLIEGG
jgi:hypothetical protein